MRLTNAHFIYFNKTTMKEKLSKEQKQELRKANKAFNEMIRKFKHALIN